MNGLQFLIYNTPQENIKVDVVVKDETIWLTQKAMAALFDVGIPAVNKHLTNVFEEGELLKEATISKMEIVQAEGNREITRKVEFYSLDAIIAVGYRVNSKRATDFRIWATKTLKEFITKGFVLDDERLKQGQNAFGKDFFRELLERIRSIRASERRIYQQITDIFSECCTDYDENAKITKDFYAMMQNKFHFAITGQTAAEIIHSKANRNVGNMGLQTWKHSPDGRILKSDVTVAKNYLQENEIKRLERAVTGYFDYIEDLVENENTFTMQQFSDSVDEFIKFRRFGLLPNKGRISKAEADHKAIEEYNEFNKTQKIISDFDKHVAKLQQDVKRNEKT